MQHIKKIGIIGAGTMGSALVQKFAQEGFEVIMIDKAENAIQKGWNHILQSLQEAVEKKVFSPEKAEKTKQQIRISLQLKDLHECDLIIEAIFENYEAKASLFREISSFIKPETLVATNTSSFSVTELSQHISHPERFLGLHYFYHAAKNRLVEIIPGKYTTEDTLKTAYYFSLQSGKDPIFTKDEYGFAVNRFFVPWLNESVKLLQEGIASIEAIDHVAMNTFGIGMGPFALMNATGVPVALHAEKTLEVFGPSYTVAPLLEQQVAKKENWPIQTLSDPFIDPKAEKTIHNRLLGCVFFVCAQILEKNICSATDLNKGARIGLKWKKGPIELMQEIGHEQVTQLIREYALLYGENVPPLSWDTLSLEYIQFRVKKETAILMFNRPEDMNALNETVFHQLDAALSKTENNSDIKNIILTGSGKAFVAGADIKFFLHHIKNNSIDEIIRFTQYAQSVCNRIELSGKRVIALLNGLTLGGGLELALCADEIYALPQAVLAFPETGIGIYPGLGGTQRSQKRVGKNLAKYLIFTGKMLNAREAAEIHLTDGVISFDQYVSAMEGDLSSIRPQKNPLPETWKKIEHIMQKISIHHLESSETTAQEDEEAEIIRKIKTKAPIALKLSEKLIEEAKGVDSELLYLKEIFSTEDAYHGLSNIGKKITFKGQ